jgi:hypothetical protein
LEPFRAGSSADGAPEAEITMSKEKAKPIRISVDLPPRSFERLEKIEELVGASSKADVVREALKVYEYLVGLAVRGVEFQMIEKGGDKNDAKTLVLFTDLDQEPLPGTRASA